MEQLCSSVSPARRHQKFAIVVVDAHRTAVSCVSFDIQDRLLGCDISHSQNTHPIGRDKQFAVICGTGTSQLVDRVQFIFRFGHTDRHIN